MIIIPIGGGDVPTVISPLNSYAGLSAAAMGFVLGSKLLIIAGGHRPASSAKSGQRSLGSRTARKLREDGRRKAAATG